MASSTSCHSTPFKIPEEDTFSNCTSSTYAPSATVLFLLRESRSADRATRNFLGVGGVVYFSPDEDGSNGGPQKPSSIADLFGLDGLDFPIFREAHKKLSKLPGSLQVQINYSFIETRTKLLSKRYPSPIFGTYISPFTALPILRFPTALRWF